MKLFVAERLNISKVLPAEGNLVTQILCRSIFEKTQLNSADITRLDLKTESDKITWDSIKDEGLDIIFEPAELKVLKEEVDKLDKENKITRDILSLCLKITDECKGN
jgi:hypothetical protein